jgi:hypothetical protein
MTDLRTKIYYLTLNLQNLNFAHSLSDKIFN